MHGSQVHRQRSSSIALTRRRVLRGAALVTGADAVDGPMKPMPPAARIMQNPHVDTAHRAA